MSNLVQIRRDPFARASLMREAVPNKNQQASCRWCGQRPKTLYRYGWESDGRAGVHTTGNFCTVGCYEAYTT